MLAGPVAEFNVKQSITESNFTKFELGNSHRSGFCVIVHNKG